MNKSRLESFTDAIVAIAMTIMVLQIVPPAEANFASLWDMRFSILIYALSFFTLAIYWKSHHHLFALGTKINHRILWLNILLLFVLTMFTFTTSWVDENLTALASEVTYGAIMLVANVIYLFLAREFGKINGRKNNNRRSWFSIGVICVGLVASIWLAPAVVISCLISLLPWIKVKKPNEI
ncbi:MAG: TMEM175 family protein [Candidatus Nomurabacteria bacterium]|jgi:uncharacterized membrane protein|nr:TMEM175 family protein [Candidatus Nomurabacteria bacterium]